MSAQTIACPCYKDHLITHFGRLTSNRNRNARRTAKGEWEHEGNLDVQDGDSKGSHVDRRALLLGTTYFAASGLSLAGMRGMCVPKALASTVIYDKGARFQGKILSTGAFNLPNTEAFIDCSFTIPERWQLKDLPSQSTFERDGVEHFVYAWSKLVDPITQDTIINKINVSILNLPKKALDISEFGPPNEIPKELPVSNMEDIQNSDIFRASQRESNEVTYYEWEVASGSNSCDERDRKLLGICPYKAATLISSAVVGGTIVALSIDMGIDEFQRFGSDARNALKSFQVTTGIPLS